MTRRDFLATSALALSGALLAARGDDPMPEPAAPRLPRRRGFNLLEMFTTRSEAQWQEDDFRWMADWGFDFVRLPLCYTLWVEGEDPLRIREAGLARVDRAVELGGKYHLHVSLNFHRAPGYSVNPEREEPFDLWKDQAALEAFCLHWSTFARRYRGIPSTRLSFDLVNEPPAPTPEGMTRAAHERVVREAVRVIREIDPERLIFADGLSWGNDPLPELADLPLAQSCRAYQPMGISHYQAPWVGGEQYPQPTWPLGEGEERWDRPRLERHYRSWADLAKQGVGVHCGEGGAYHRTPHDVFLAWFRDVLEVLREHEIGWALWNFRGSFGLLDSGRAEVAYEDWHGHQLDRQLLALLQEL
jgi:endoglucanase